MQLQRFPLIVLAFAIGGCSAPNDAEMEQDRTTLTERNEAVIRQVLALIDERNLDEAFELYALDYIYHGPTGELRGRDSTYLLHQAKTIELIPRFDELTIRNAKDFGNTECDLPVGRRNAHELTGMGALNSPSQNDFVTFRNHVFNCGMKIREANKKDLP